MVVSNGLFDALLFGALLLGLALDAAIPGLQGTAFLVACGLAVYMAAQEWSEALARRGLWTQEPLATAIALSSGGFVYFYLRNGSDFVLLVLSIGLMMGSLMVTIATIGALSAMAKQMSPAPLLGYLATLAGALVMGTLSGLLTLQTPIVAKAGVVIISFALWKLRETLAPPVRKAGELISPTQPSTPGSQASSEIAESIDAVPAPAIHAPVMHASALPNQIKWQLIPKRGTLLDRFLPVLLVGGLMILGVRQSGNLLHSVSPPASAANGNATSE